MAFRMDGCARVIVAALECCCIVNNEELDTSLQHDGRRPFHHTADMQSFFTLLYRYSRLLVGSL
jgi:hypothetical protein